VFFDMPEEIIGEPAANGDVRATWYGWSHRSAGGRRGVGCSFGLLRSSSRKPYEGGFGRRHAAGG